LNKDTAFVITIDGPGGSGKGTIAQLLAQKLGWHLLDSGALYRILALAAQRENISPDDITALVDLAPHLHITFRAGEAHEPVNVFLNGEEVTQSVRSETVGDFASKIAALPEVRAALLEKQREFRQPPGLVTDGRDMGTTVFPHASVKFFLTATCEERAKRRYKQLMAKGIVVKLAALQKELAARDIRDKERAASPLKQAEDAIVIDTTGLTIEQVFARVLSEVRQRLG
jgi:cytidylate kinase